MPDADEIRWLLTNWIDGPVLLFLNDNFQRFRADQQPVFRILDRDRDGKVSAEELKQAVVSFQECDLDRNDIVDATELAEVAKNPRDQPAYVSHSKLIFRLPEEATASLTFRRLAAIYADAAASTPTSLRFDGNQDGQFDADELKQLSDGAADIHLKIDFDTTAPDTSRLSIIGFSPEFVESKQSAMINTDNVTLTLPQVDLEFTAAQGSADDQISVGAVDDGYAMLPELDPNGDGRFSIRELRELNERLSSFDRNGDGEITRDEIHPTIRVCIGLGPIAHQPLALLRSAKTSAASTPTGPDWFHQMDKNRDNDISRKEFPGTDEQFKQLDADGDDLISAVEANESEKPK